VPSDSGLLKAKHPGLWLSTLDDYADLPDQLEHTMLELVGAHASPAGQAPVSGAVQAAAYHLASGGQRVRARLALSAGLSLGLSKPDALCLAAAAELLHNASLVHDDLQDSDALRHGQQAVWIKFGASVAICTGDLMLSAAYAALCGIREHRVLPALLALVHARVVSAIAGQCADLGQASRAVDDVAAYRRIALAKSGALLSLPLELALLASGHGACAELARDAAQAFSVGYQIVDDLADVERDSQSGALNIVFVLRHAGYGAGAYAQARLLGLERLDRAIALANELPLESGALLVELSLKLRHLLLVKND
jgi:geranylgeranyl pyrophosphate synthase